MKTKREVDLEQCLEKTLKDLGVIDEKAPLISWATTAESNDLVYAATKRALRRIQRTLGRK